MFQLVLAGRGLLKKKHWRMEAEYLPLGWSLEEPRIDDGTEFFQTQSVKVFLWRSAHLWMRHELVVANDSDKGVNYRQYALTLFSRRGVGQGREL
jgi:hypothetical protein